MAPGKRNEVTDDIDDLDKYSPIAPENWLDDPYHSKPGIFSGAKFFFVLGRVGAYHSFLFEIYFYRRQDHFFTIFPQTGMGVSKNRGTPKSSILIGFYLINHPFWGTPILGNTYILLQILFLQNEYVRARRIGRIGQGEKTPCMSLLMW